MAVGDRTEKRLGGPTQLGTTATQICYVDLNRQEIIKQIIICNTDTVDRTVSLAIGSVSSASKRIMSQLPIGANDTMVFDTALVLNAEESLEGLSDVADKVTVVAVGWEKEV
jgi:hypothetical protein